jgi:uncharacterized protein
MRAKRQQKLTPFSGQGPRSSLAPRGGLNNSRRMSAPSVYYQCQRCTNCCRWPGDVKVDDAEVAAIAAYLGLSTEEFIQRYTRLRLNRQGLSIIERPDHSCIFLEGRDCLINDVKPQQCRDFPNKWRFPGWRQVCEAIELPAPP